MKKIILLFYLSLFSALYPISLKDRIIAGKNGEYVVFEYGSIASVLLVRAMTENSILIEEINVPSIAYPPENMSWKEWVLQEAPGHIAWTSYLINTKTDQLEESYSHADRSWFSAKDPNHFLPTLLKLSLVKTPDAHRKRIGPPPSDDQIDCRSLWYPTLTLEGKKVDRPHITAWQAKWPQDESIIGGSEIEMYFSTEMFPLWIEVKIPHYKAHFRSIDMGYNMISPKPVVFTQKLKFQTTPKLSKKGLSFTAICPHYYGPVKVLLMTKLDTEQKQIEIGQLVVQEHPVREFFLPYDQMLPYFDGQSTYHIALRPALSSDLTIYTPVFFDLQK